jgi:hypothetical protein
LASRRRSYSHFKVDGTYKPAGADALSSAGWRRSGAGRSTKQPGGFALLNTKISKKKVVAFVRAFHGYVGIS